MNKGCKVSQGCLAKCLALYGCAKCHTCKGGQPEERRRLQPYMRRGCLGSLALACLNPGSPLRGQVLQCMRRGCPESLALARLTLGSPLRGQGSEVRRKELSLPAEVQHPKYHRDLLSLP